MTTYHVNTEWDVLNPSEPRHQLDATVFDTLGLMVGEREAVYAGVAEMLDNRKRDGCNTEADDPDLL